MKRAVLRYTATALTLSTATTSHSLVHRQLELYGLFGISSPSSSVTFSAGDDKLEGSMDKQQTGSKGVEGMICRSWEALVLSLEARRWFSVVFWDAQPPISTGYEFMAANERMGFRVKGRGRQSLDNQLLQVLPFFSDSAVLSFKPSSKQPAEELIQESLLIYFLGGPCSSLWE